MSVGRLQPWLQMGAAVAGKIGHLVNHAGRDHARRVVPKELRAIVGKPE